MTEPASAGQALPRAFLRVAGASLARHQLGLVLALDCQRVICIARGTSPDLIALQHAAEDAGLQFHIVTDVRRLSGLVTEADELFVVSEGLFVDPGQVSQLFEGGSSLVLVLPVESALSQGFERIDLNRAAAGLMRVPGRLIERLHELPSDYDVPSALIRIALQSGIEMREVPPTSRAGAGWRLIRNEAEAFAVETEWLNEQFNEGGRPSPGRSIARFGVMTFGSSLLHAGNASNIMAVAVLAVLAIATSLGWFGLGWIGFVCVTIAALLVETVRLLRLAERQALGQMPPAIPRSDALGWLVDTAIGLLCLTEIPRIPGEALVSWAFPPVMLMMLLSLVPGLLTDLTAAWSRDRFVLGIILAVAAVFGQVQVTVEVLAVGLLLTGVLLPMRRQD
jgi:hypothetical protein